MKVVQLRLPEKLYEKLSANAAQDGVKVSQYMRSLLERALIFEKQIEFQNSSSSERDSFLTDIVMKNTKATVEGTILLRELITRVAAEEKDELIKQADGRAKDYVKRLQPEEELY